MSWIDVRDIAAVAAAVLCEDGHEGRIYDLSGPQSLSHHEIAASLSSAIGRAIRYEPLSDTEAFQQMIDRGLPAPAARSMLSLYQAYREGRHWAGHRLGRASMPLPRSMGIGFEVLL